MQEYLQFFVSTHNQFEVALTMMVFIAVVYGLGFGVVKLIEGFRKFLRKREARKQLATEKVRIEALPKLNKRWLMPVAEKGMKKGTPRTFGNRYNRLLVFDEEGNPWVGLFMPEILQGLRDGEYVQEDYYIPFRGDGEACAGERVTVNGVKITIYPRWMNPNATETPEWHRWAEIEKGFQSLPRNYDYQQEFWDRIRPGLYDAEKKQDHLRELEQQAC